MSLLTLDDVEVIFYEDVPMKVEGSGKWHGFYGFSINALL